QKKKLGVAFGLEKSPGEVKPTSSRIAEFGYSTPVEARAVKRTPNRNTSKSSRYFDEAVDEPEYGGSNDEDVGSTDRGDSDNSVNDYIRHLSFDKTESAPTPRLTT
ncbi:hypothetical protein PI126_g20094, partial [Phytophthora idaei]